MQKFHGRFGLHPELGFIFVICYGWCQTKDNNSLCKSYQSQASALVQACFSPRPPKPMPELAVSSLAICKADVLAQVCISFHPPRPMEGIVCQGAKITHRCTCLNIVYSRTERIELRLRIAHFRSREDSVAVAHCSLQTQRGLSFRCAKVGSGGGG